MKKTPPTSIRLRGIRYPNTAATPPKVWIDDKFLSLEKSLRIKNHSIHGFGWGSDAKGAAQLAFAICSELYPDTLARLIYPDFRVMFLDGIDSECFDITLNLTAFNEIHVKHLTG